MRWLTHAQVDRLLGELPAHQQDLRRFALATGLRQGNIKRLTWDQVDLTRHIVTIEHGETKNGEALGVPLNDLAVSVLERQMGKQCEHVFTYAGASDRAGEYAALAGGLESGRHRRFPLARPAPYLGELATAE